MLESSKLLDHTATAIAAVAALLFVVGVISDVGFLQALGGSFNSLSFNDHIRQALEVSSFIAAAIAGAASGLTLMITDNPYRSRTTVTLLGIARKTDAARSKSKRRILLIVISILIVVVVAQVTKSFLFPSHDSVTLYDKAFDRMSTSMYIVFLSVLYAGVFVAFDKQDRIILMLRSRSRREKNRIARVGRIVALLMATVTGTTVIFLFGGIQANIALRRNADILEINGQEAMRVVVLKFVDSGIIAYDHCADRLMLIALGDNWRITRGQDRNFGCEMPSATTR